jgi:2-dehydro-3-deoxyglucarate aldolase/4-hydroxy-2-oxoheptanedioate aldolase
MRINHTKAKLAEGKTVFGCGLQQYRSSEIPRLFAAAGFDYVFIDMEHGLFDLETVHDMIAASVSAGITPIVRVGELLYSLVARVLDAGAQGVIFPRVEEPRTLENALAWTRFPPAGQRGYGVMPQAIDYETQTFSAIVEHLNAQTMVVVQFETRTAMERADELLSVPGFDVAMVGPADLSVSLGVPGQFDSPLLVDTVVAFIEKCNRHGIVPGIQTRSVAHARLWAERGMRLVGAGGEQGLLLEAARAAVAELNKARGAAQSHAR